MSDKRPTDQQAFEERTRSLFKASVESLDGRTQSKLTQARHAALEELSPARSTAWGRGRAALAGVTVATVVAAWIGYANLGSPTSETGELPLDDFDIVAEAPNLELLEDVEFYAWIAEQPGQSG
jgi:hypothetical protein